MSDRDAIVDLVARYAHAVDDRDVEAVLGCFAPNGRIDLDGGVTSGQGHKGIRAVFEQAFTSQQLAPPAASTHVMSSTLVTAEGDAATATTQAVAHLVNPGTGGVTARGLRYRDELRRLDGRWCIVHRVHRCTWQAVTTAEVATFPSPIPSAEVLAAVDDHVRAGDEP